MKGLRDTDPPFWTDAHTVLSNARRHSLDTLERLEARLNLTPEQRRDLRLIGGGIGIHWPQLDEDLSVRGLLFPHPEDAQRVS